jgi:hypothetical protein
VDGYGIDEAGLEKLLTRPAELSGNATSKDIWEQVEETDAGVRILHINIRDTSTVL